METLDEIWEGDLFRRRHEADDLVGYLESVAGRVPIREDGHAHVLAVDTAYGHGKTFFLRRLNRHLKATDHVSAYIDAWVDDLEDQPLVALAATLDRALEPWKEKNGEVADGLADFKSKAGRVAKIVGIGLAKRGAGFLITQGAAEALSDELAKASEVTRVRAGDALKDAGTGIVDNVAVALEPALTPSMDAKIARFREGQDAIQAMKNSLSNVVEALAEVGMKLPITIIVDELDRCRPTYAIKVLEEIKHLFDVQGVAFLLGLHGQQLAHSVTAAYGQGFDGTSYLRRFFDRRYSLKQAPLNALIQHLIGNLDIDVSRLAPPQTFDKISGRKMPIDPANVIASYLEIFELSARDAFGVMEALQTALALTGTSRVELSYLLPLIISQHKGADRLIFAAKEPEWQFAFYSDFGDSRSPTEIAINEFLVGLDKAARMTDNQLSGLLNKGNDIFAGIVSEYGFRNNSSNYGLLQNYRELVRTVARFA